jgi:hypothetical protein
MDEATELMREALRRASRADAADAEVARLKREFQGDSSG